MKLYFKHLNKNKDFINIYIEDSIKWYNYDLSSLQCI